MSSYKPLAEILRPNDLSEFIGQRHLLDPDKPIGKALADNQLHSMILWGPSGVGKTTTGPNYLHADGRSFRTNVRRA